jgi:hypothetical protein
MKSLDTHHIVSRTYNGSNKQSNLTKLCPNCHRKVHSGEIIIEGWFMTSIGRQLLWRDSGEKIITERKDPKVFNIYKGKSGKI